jgi:hypothetical protein
MNWAGLLVIAKHNLDMNIKAIPRTIFRSAVDQSHSHSELVFIVKQRRTQCYIWLRGTEGFTDQERQRYGLK